MKHQFLILVKSIITILTLTISGQQVYANEQQVFYLNDYANNDSIVYCPGEDSLKLIAPESSGFEAMWQINFHQDTLWSNSIVVPNGYDGDIIYSSAEINKTVYFTVFSARAEAISSVACNSNVELSAITNSINTEGLVYEWSPAEGLSETVIANPVANFTSGITYTVKISSPLGCTVEESVELNVEPMSAPKLCMSSVSSDSKFSVMWEKPISMSIDSFFVYKETNKLDVYEKIGAMGYDEPGVFIDLSSDAKVQANKYKLSMLDKCGLESEMSDFHKTVHLSINKGINNVWNLIWEPYVGFTATTYNIYRGTNPDNLEIIASISGANSHYSDYSAPEGYVHYQIEVEKEDACLIDFDDETAYKSQTIFKSRSNIASNDNGSAISKNKTDQIIQLFPNPVIEALQIKNLTGEDFVPIQIFSLNGNIVLQRTLKRSSETINLKHLSPGIYLLHFNVDQQKVIRKIVKL